MKGRYYKKKTTKKKKKKKKGRGGRKSKSDWKLAFYQKRCRSRVRSQKETTLDLPNKKGVKRKGGKERKRDQARPIKPAWILENDSRN